MLAAYFKSRSTRANHQLPVSYVYAAMQHRMLSDVADNLDRNGILDRKLQEANKESDDIHLIIEILQWGNDSVSYALLAGLRLGISVQDLAWAVRTGSVPSGYGHV